MEISNDCSKGRMKPCWQVVICILCFTLLFLFESVITYMYIYIPFMYADVCRSECMHRSLFLTGWHAK